METEPPARSEVPYRGGRLHVQVRQSCRPHGQFGYEIFLVQVEMIRNAECQLDFRRILPFQNDEVEVGEFHAPGLGQGQRADFFIGCPKILKYGHGETVGTAFKQGTRHFRRGVGRIGKHGDEIGADQSRIERRKIRTSVQGDKVHLLPRQPQTRGRHLHGGRARFENQVFPPEFFGQPFADTEEERVAVREDNDFFSS